MTNFYGGKHVLACFLNNIYYNICSESLKGSSKELTLFTWNFQKAQIHVTIVFKLEIILN